MLKIAKNSSQIMPAVRVARKGFGDQKIEMVAKNGKSESRKNLRSVMPGYCLLGLIILKRATREVRLKRTSQTSGRESSRFIEVVAPKLMIG